MDYVPPRPVPAPRIAPLAVLPVFLRLDGRLVVVAGANDAAAWKTELAEAAGARVAVLVPPWNDRDFEGAALAIGALEGDDAVVFADAARRAGVPVNIVDTPDLSTFSFGTIVNRNPVTIGISTDGVAPVLGQAIRTKIETLLHPALGAWAGAARQLREAVSARVGMGAARRELWGRFAGAALAARKPPVPGEIEGLMAGPLAAGGSVALVGAGPGDPELLTIRALRVLQSADVILYDRLVEPRVLELARREAERILVGKRGGGVHCRQDEITALMLRLAGEGKRVVRLKGGDPSIFGRATEEIAACRAAGVPVEVVPGVTAALGAAAELLVPLTDRKLAKRVQIVTGHSELGEAPEHDWPSLADPWATTVFYMGSRTFADMLPRLLEAGLDPETPAIAVAAATTSRRASVSGSITGIGAKLAALDENEPRLILIGRAMAGVLPADDQSQGFALERSR